MVLSTHILVLLAVLVRISSCGILGSLGKRNNIQYVSNSLCTDKEIAKIGESYSDALRLAQFTLGSLGDAANELVTRFFGSDAVGANSTTNSQIRETFANIGSWWPVPYFDQQTGYTISFSCNDISNTCLTHAGGYASNNANGPLITICPDFFDDTAFPTLDERKEYLDANPKLQKNLKYFGTAGMLILHEMVHLEVISGVSDYTQFTGSENVTFFGSYRSEWLAYTDQTTARNNADNFALFALANWFSYYYGLPAQATSTNGFLCTNNIFDINDIPFADGNITYILNNGTGGTVEWGPIGYTENENEIESLVAAVATFTAPPGAQISLVPDVVEKVQGKIMRILPLGDSITNGYQSSDGNGYRLPLYESLITGNTITMVGSMQSGTMLENSNEGIDGATISQIATDTTASLLLRPNVILLHAGTNDMNNPTLPTTAPDRLGALIDQIILACPDAVVLVAQIIPSGTEATMANIVQFNIGVESEVEARVLKGNKVMLIDMSHLLNADDYADALHPNDSGYAKLATAWLEGIMLADQAGWIGIPFGVTVPTTASSSVSTKTTSPARTTVSTVTLTSMTSTVSTSPAPSVTPTKSTSSVGVATSPSAVCVPAPTGKGTSGAVLCTPAGPPNGPSICSCLFQDQGISELMFTPTGNCADLSVSSTTCGL